MVRRVRPPSVGETMVTRAGLLMVLVVVGLGLVAQWAYSTGRTWLVVVAGVAAVAVVIALNHAGSRPRRPPRGRGPGDDPPPESPG